MPCTLTMLRATILNLLVFSALFNEQLTFHPLSVVASCDLFQCQQAMAAARSTRDRKERPSLPLSSACLTTKALQVDTYDLPIV